MWLRSNSRNSCDPAPEPSRRFFIRLDIRISRADRQAAIARAASVGRGVDRMSIRRALLAATILAMPAAAGAQPVSGLYVGLGAGANWINSPSHLDLRSGSF